MADEDEDILIEGSDVAVTKLDSPSSGSSCFSVYNTLADGFMAGIIISGRSADVGSLSKMFLKDRVAFAMSDAKEWDATLGAGAVQIVSLQESDKVRRGSSRNSWQNHHLPQDQEVETSRFSERPSHRQVQVVHSRVSGRRLRWCTSGLC